ncbi:hypothetical protein [Pseudomonas sp. GV085]|uniref:hypothetical protein n=1 Tax=Pseudomonas sp. GV085 TaxID=2135756 RepID=UPI000D3B75A4|nr:hypothetical protein [Pseudomonas sp. GV085]PTR28263.1 hypothetical protein C8K63_102492 [Pseudomonas sp. GV085]
MTAELTTVTAAASPWEPATLWINGKKVERGAKLVLLRGQENEVMVEAPLEIARELNLGLAENGGLTIEALPKFGEWIKPVNGKFTWKIRPEAGKSGRVTLVFFSREVDEVWEHLSLVISRDLADEVTVLLDGVAIPASGVDFHGGVTKTLTLSYKNAEVLKGVPLALDWIPDPGLVTGDLVSQPPLGQPSPTHVWKLTGTQVKSGTFKLKLFSEGETTVLLTPTNRLLERYKLRFLRVIDGEYVELPVPPAVVQIPMGAYFTHVRVTGPDNSPISGVSVTVDCSATSPTTGITNAAGIMYGTVGFGVGEYELSAVSTLDGKPYTASLRLDVRNW